MASDWTDTQPRDDDAPGTELPVDLDAEQAVLGSCVIDPGAITVLLRTRPPLAADDFYLPTHAAIFNAMLALHRRGEPGDTVLLANYLREAGLLEDIGGVAYLASLAAITPTSMNAEHYAKMVIKHSHERKMIELGGQLAAAGRQGGSVAARLRRFREQLDWLESREAGEVGGPDYKLDVIASMDDVTRELVDWLWYPYIPYGKLTLIEGEPGVRKSWLSLAIAAAVTHGWGFPGDKRVGAEPGKVLLLAAEDDLGDTVRPRLEDIGANLTMVRPVMGLVHADEKRPFTLDPAGIAALREHVEEYQPQLVIIDPLIAYTPSKTDVNSAIDVRSMLQPLIDLAADHELALIGLRHWKKGADSATNKGAGSIDYFASARSVLAVAKDKDRPGRSIMAPSKANLAEEAPGVAYVIGRMGAGPGTEFLWDGIVEMSVEQMLAPLQNPEEHTAIEEAKRFLREELADGAVYSEELKKRAVRGDAPGWRTIETAKNLIGVKARKETGKGVKGRWEWYLPFDVRGNLPEADRADVGPVSSSSPPDADDRPEIQTFADEWKSRVDDGPEEV